MGTALRWGRGRRSPSRSAHEEFGYHEIFHAIVVLAAALHFIALSRVVLGAG